MTADEFFVALARTRALRCWRVTPDAGVRDRTGGCPITVVYEQETGRGCPVDDAGAAGEALGLSLLFIAGVIEAADGSSEPALRERLLRALGLPPFEPKEEALVISP
jgi:hypothetical protein